jgi:hypothetical protein
VHKLIPILALQILLVSGLLASCTPQATPPKMQVTMSSALHVVEDDPPASEQGVITIGKVGAGLLKWQAKSGSTWLEVRPDSGTLDSENATSNVVINTTGLKAGDYTTQIDFADVSNPSDNKTVLVTLTVASKPSPFPQATDYRQLLNHVGELVTVTGRVISVKPESMLFPVKRGNINSILFSIGSVPTRLDQNIEPKEDAYLLFAEGNTRDAHQNNELLSTSKFRIFVSRQNLWKYDRHADSSIAVIQAESSDNAALVLMYQPFKQIINRNVRITGIIRRQGDAPLMELVDGTEIEYQ